MSLNIHVNPQNTHMLLRGSPDAIKQLRGLPGVRWVERYSGFAIAANAQNGQRILENFALQISAADEDRLRCACGINRVQPGTSYNDVTNNLLPGLNKTPWKHQVAAYQFVRNLPGSFLLMGMGCGKSMTAACVAASHLEDADFLNLIVCPSAVVPVWPHEFAAHLSNPPRVLPLVKGSVAKKNPGT